MTHPTEPRVTQADRIALCDIMNVSREVRADILTGMHDDLRNVARGLRILREFRTVAEAAARAREAELREALEKLHEELDGQWKEWVSGCCEPARAIRFVSALKSYARSKLDSHDAALLARQADGEASDA